MSQSWLSYRLLNKSLAACTEGELLYIDEVIALYFAREELAPKALTTLDMLR